MHAVCATANICQADGRKQRRPLRKTCRSYFEGFLGGEGRRLGREATREEKYTSEKKKKKKKALAQARAAMEKYYFMRGNTGAHPENSDAVKTRLSVRHEGLHETGGTLRGGRSNPVG